MTSPLAAVDCGSNSVRLLVAGPDGAELERRSVVTALASGMGAARRLTPEAIARTAKALRGFRSAVESAEVRFVATAAVREAVNPEDFLVAAEDALGLRPEVIGGEREARLGFDGATSGLDRERGPFLVLDLGGASTEFSYGTERCESVVSCPVGSVGLTDRYVDHDPPLPEELYACLSVTEAHLEDVVAGIPAAGDAACLVGLAGTVTTAAAVEIGLAEYDSRRIHHFELSRSAVEDVFRTLATEDRAARLANPGMHPGRVDVIVAGMCVLAKIMRFFEFDSCLVSESDLLHGLIAELRAERAGRAGYGAMGDRPPVGSHSSLRG